MQIDSLVTGLDLIATFAFAIVGARIAANKGLDYGGIALIAAVASVSGGTLRNLFMGQRPPWILHSWLFASIALAVLITVIAKQKKPVGRFLLALDTFGLAVATVSSANFAATRPPRECPNKTTCLSLFLIILFFDNFLQSLT